MTALVGALDQSPRSVAEPPTRHRPRAASSTTAVEAEPGHAFPEPRFPAGVAVPPAALLTIVLAAAAAAAVPPLRVDLVAGGTPGWTGLLAGAAPVVAALLAFTVLRLVVVRPVRRVRDAVRDAVRAGANGHPAPASGRSAIGEADRILVALPRGRSGPVRRAPMAGGLLLVAAILLSGLGAQFALAYQRSTQPETVLQENDRTTAAAAEELRRTLVEGLSGVQGAAATDAAAPTEPQVLAATLLRNRPVFRSAYVLTGDGSMGGSAGRDPQRPSAAVPAPGVSQLNTAGRTPVVVAAARLDAGARPGEGARTLVAEYDPRSLNAGLRHAGGHLTVVDSGQRTLLSSSGYQAFDELTDPTLRSATEATRPDGPVSTFGDVDGAAAAVAARRIGTTDMASGLGWVVLRAEELRSAEFARDPITRASMTISGMATAIALFVLAWIQLTIVRPLRELGRHAEAAAESRPGQPAPPPVAPRRLDEVGAIAAGLNHLLARRTAPHRSAVPARHTVPTAGR